MLEVGRFAAGASGRAADAEADMLQRFWLWPAASAPLAPPDGAAVGEDATDDADFLEPFGSDADADEEDGWRSDETGASDSM